MRKSSHPADKALVIAGLTAVIACAWAYLVPTSLDMYGRMDGAAAWMMEATWDGRYLLLVFLMWSAMMVAMIAIRIRCTMDSSGKHPDTQRSSSPTKGSIRPQAAKTRSCGSGRRA